MYCAFIIIFHSLNLSNFKNNLWQESKYKEKKVKFKTFFYIAMSTFCVNAFLVS